MSCTSGSSNKQPDFDWVDFRIAALFTILLGLTDAGRVHCEAGLPPKQHLDFEWADFRIALLFAGLVAYFAVRHLKGDSAHSKLNVPLLKRGARHAPEALHERLEPAPIQSPFTQQIAKVPSEIRGKMMRPLKLCDMAALCSTCRHLQVQLWDSPDAWCSMAADRAILIDPGASGEEAREAFRRTMCRIDGSRLRNIPPHRYVAILEESALMVSGLLRRDGDKVVEEVCVIAERALHAHDPAQELSVIAADLFLSSVHRAVVIFTESQLERIEYAYHSAQQLHTLMVSSMRQRSEDAILESFWDDGPSSFDECGSTYADDAHASCHEEDACEN